MREQPSGLELLMGTRGARARFMPNRLVFPGGGVERGDFRTQPATPLRPPVLDHLTRGAPARLAHALAAAAARELEEETGLSLGRPPQLDALNYLCRAITPPNSPIRFSARFLVVDADRLSGTLAGSGELEDLRFYPLQEALAMDLISITREVLAELQDWLALSEHDRLHRPHVRIRRTARWHLE